MEKNQAIIGHFDVVGPELGTLSKFYNKMFGWEVTSRGPGYSQLQTPELNGAIVEQSEASLTVGIVVDDLDQALEQVKKLGGTVIMPATSNGWVTKAQVEDPAGNTLTLIQK